MIEDEQGNVIRQSVAQPLELGQQSLHEIEGAVETWRRQVLPIRHHPVVRQVVSALDSWRVDETYIKVKGEWKYVYRAVDSEGNMRLFHVECQEECARRQNGSSAKL